MTAPVTTAGMLQQVFDDQINRLFWPCGVKLDGTEAALPPYVWKMLKTRLKTVYYYSPLACGQSEKTGETLELRVAPNVDTVVQESLDLLPDTLRSGQLLPTSQCYEPVSVEDFLEEMSGRQQK